MLRNNNKGFTLIELLVVIAIIAILAAILFPVFAKAKEAAGKATCLNNLKQLGSAQLLYRDSYSDRLPLHVSSLGAVQGHSAYGNFWTYYMLLNKYTRTKNGSFVCPQTIERAPKTNNAGKKIYAPGQYPCEAGINACPGSTVAEKKKYLKENYGYVYGGNPYKVTSYAAWAYPRNCIAPRSQWNCFVVSSYYSKQSKIAYMLEAVEDLIYWNEAIAYTADDYYSQGGRLAPRHGGGNTACVMFFDGHCEALDKKYISANLSQLMGYYEHVE